jgi:hypothetical protein
MTDERAIDDLAREAEALRNLRPLRVFADLEQERDERRPWPQYDQLGLCSE